jgi:hypothetical protein
MRLRGTLKLFAKLGMALAALFVVSVLLAAMPAHRSPEVQPAAQDHAAAPVTASTPGSPTR